MTAAANASEVTDDSEGYYCYRSGEILNGKYSIIGSFGKGVFSTVLRAKDLHLSNLYRKLTLKL